MHISLHTERRSNSENKRLTLCNVGSGEKGTGKTRFLQFFNLVF